MSSTPTATAALERTVDRALERLAGWQAATGELLSYASPLGEGPPEWTPDPLKFVTALGAVALHEVPDPRAAKIVDRAVEFLRGERETCAQWRYWAQANEQFDFTPPDADDTSCCSLAVRTRGDRTRANVAVLLANRDPQGRFYTWLVPHGRSLDPRRAWAMRDEYRSAVRRRREELWSTTEAQRDDVDGVVNTNVIRYLGPRRAPAAAIEWIVSIVEEGREDDCDAWHRNRYTLYAAMADAHLRGIERFGSVAPTILDRIEARVDDSGTVGPPLDTALALLAVQGFGGTAALRERLAAGLVETQEPEGAWTRSVFYHGGPMEVFGWASEALTAAWALQALHRELRGGPVPSIRVR